MLRAIFRKMLPCALLLAGTTAFTAAAERPAAPPPRPAGAPVPSDRADRFFETSVRPVLATRCQSCHGPELQQGGLRVDSLQALLKGGASGPAVVTGKPEQSLLLKALTYQHDRLKMPPGGKLPDRQVADLSRWIDMGAPWPSTPVQSSVRGQPSAQRPTTNAHWAFQPVRRPPVPKVRDAAWVRTPVDAFILAELEKRGLRPAPPADRRTLIRRATFDLTGLPPTPEEIGAFLADRSSDAYEKVVERLLASPAYGERWGRHWLDVARYADSNGLDENVAHGNAWRYRDWVIRCFNEDKPYDRFVTEQLAGDLLPSEDTPTRYGRLIATGFLSLGPKVLAEVDKEKMVMDIVDEQIDTMGRAFMGLTLGCARCHDHKFDPISTEDYYALAGVFKSTKTMESLVTIAKWWENPIPQAEDLARKAAHDRRVAEVEAQINALVERSRQELIAGGKAGSELPKDVETAFQPEVRAELKKLRDRLAEVKKEAPEIPAAMGVTEAEPVDVPVHVRGDHLNLGTVVPRRFPVILAGREQEPLPAKRSGRLELARWLTSPEHPLASRVAVNRVWRWHFGRGIVATTDNFGLLGEKPSHPELLDYLASRFASPAAVSGVDGETEKGRDRTKERGESGLGWSMKNLHRLIMLSSTYRQASTPDSQRSTVHPPDGGPDAQRLDPENRMLWRANVRRLEAEELRDALLAVSGMLDRTMGGSLLHVKNREFFFDHTSIDRTRYDSKKRSVYLPVVRNNVYDVFQLFDFVDPAVLESNRSTTTVAPQALFWMNSELVADAAQALANGVLGRRDLDDTGRMRLLYVTLYGRPASEQELARGRAALARLLNRASPDPPASRRAQAWAWYCHALLATNEFVYLR
jgi:hypothetical protein